jgi:hypothetical protein
MCVYQQKYSKDNPALQRAAVADLLEVLAIRSSLGDLKIMEPNIYYTETIIFDIYVFEIL